MREEEAPRTPKPAMSSPLTTPRWKEPAVPTGSGTPEAFLLIVLKDLLPQWLPEALGDTKNLPNEGEVNILNMQKGDLEELYPQEKVQ